MSTSSPLDGSTNTSGTSSTPKPRCNTPLTPSWEREAELKQQIVRYLKRRWPTAWVYCPTDRLRSGIPDILCIIPPSGVLLAIEVKTPTGRVTPIQTATLTNIRRAGATAWVLRSMEELHHVIVP